METESGADSTLYGPWSLNGNKPSEKFMTKDCQIERAHDWRIGPKPTKHR